MLIIGSLYLVLYFQRRFCPKTTVSELVSRSLPLALANSNLGRDLPLQPNRSYKFSLSISGEMLGNYLSQSICMESLVNGRGDLNDGIRMLRDTGAKYIGRSICLWGGKANLLSNFQRAAQRIPQVHAADPEMVLEACIFEIVTTGGEQVSVWRPLALPPRNCKRRLSCLPACSTKNNGVCMLA